MTRTVSLLCILVVSIGINPALAHEVRTHQNIGNAAVAYLQATAPMRRVLPNLQQLLLIGAVQEDDDPLPGAPCPSALNLIFQCPVLGRYFFHFSPVLNDVRLFGNVLAAANCSSIQWGLDPTVDTCTASITGPGVNPVALASNIHKWDSLIAANILAGDARLPSQESIIHLGYLLHLLEDLGSPPHARDSMHPCLASLVYCEPFERDNDNRTPCTGSTSTNSLCMPGGPTIISTAGFTSPQQYFAALQQYTSQNYYSTETVFAPNGPCTSQTPCSEDRQYFYGACIPNVSGPAGTCVNGSRKVAAKGSRYWSCVCDNNSVPGGCTYPLVNSECNALASIDSTIAMEQFNELGPVIAQVVASFIEFYAPALTVTTSGNVTVSSDVGNINCGTNCSGLFVQGTTVTLTAQTSAGQTVTWVGDGACTGSNPSVTLVLKADMNCAVTAGEVWMGTATGTVITAPCANGGTAEWSFTVTLTLTSFSGPPWNGLPGTFGNGTSSAQVLAVPTGSVCQALPYSTSNVPIYFQGGAFTGVTPGNNEIAIGRLGPPWLSSA